MATCDRRQYLFERLCDAYKRNRFYFYPIVLMYYRTHYDNCPECSKLVSEQNRAALLESVRHRSA